ncbi:MAG: hypothetical protein WKF89_07070 [Chitinophagaceae bacterium]
MLHDKEKIRKASGTHITTDLQAKIFAKLVEIQTPYNELVKLLKDNRFKFDRRSSLVNDQNGVFEVEDGGKLLIRSAAPFILTFIKKLKIT